MTAARRTPGSTWPCGRPVTSQEAREILNRFVASHFGEGGVSQLRFSVPADVNRDDDLRVLQFANQYDDLVRVAQRALAEVTATTEGTCGCNGTPPLCLTCDLRDVLGKAGGV